MIVAHRDANDAGRLMFGYHWQNVFGLFFYDPGVTVTNTDTDWHHWAGTYDVATGARCLYRDGTLVASDTAPTPYQGSGRLYIGREPFGDPAYFDGGIDDVRIWEVARSVEEINASMCNPLTGTETNLLAYWTFDERAGTRAFDGTIDGHHGTLENGPVWAMSMVPCGQSVVDRVLTIYFAGTGATLAWAQTQSSGWDAPELLATLYTQDQSDAVPGSPASTHYKKFVNGIGTGGVICLGDLLSKGNPDWGSRGWDVCLNEGMDALRNVLEAHPGDTVTLNLLGWSRGGVLTMKMARRVSDMQDAHRVSKINILAFDPVPGITTVPVSRTIESLGMDAILSSKVNQFVGIYAQDERSYKFEPLIPDITSPNTVHWLFRVRGSHETLVGNTQIDGHGVGSTDFLDCPPYSKLTEFNNTSGLGQVGQISRAVAQELLISAEWGMVPFAPANLWSTGHPDPEARLVELIDGMNANGNTKYLLMPATVFTVLGWGTYDPARWIVTGGLWGRGEMVSTLSVIPVVHSRLCFMAPRFSTYLLNHDRVFWLEEGVPDFINRNTAWDVLRSLAREAPMLQLTAPNRGETWARGRHYLIHWNDNIAEDVVIALFKGGALLTQIATVPSTGVYEWEVDSGLDPGSDYAIRITSTVNGTLSDASDMTFTICDIPAVDLNSMMCLPGGRMQFDFTVAGAVQATVLGSTNLLNWEELQTVPLTGGHGTFVDENADDLPCRFYRLRVP